MIHAYDKVYLEKARTALGRMLDFAVYDLKYEIGDFWGLFLASGIAKRFGEGDFQLLVGMSGVELAFQVLECSGIENERIIPMYAENRSEEYWAGWALAYYQWEAGMSFEEINLYVPIKEVLGMYDPIHEMDIRQFVDAKNVLYKERKKETNLKILICFFDFIIFLFLVYTFHIFHVLKLCSRLQLSFYFLQMLDNYIYFHYIYH